MGHAPCSHPRRESPPAPSSARREAIMAAAIGHLSNSLWLSCGTARQLMVYRRSGSGHPLIHRRRHVDRPSQCISCSTDVPGRRKRGPLSPYPPRTTKPRNVSCHAALPCNGDPSRQQSDALSPLRLPKCHAMDRRLHPHSRASATYASGSIAHDPGVRLIYTGILKDRLQTASAGYAHAHPAEARQGSRATSFLVPVNQFAHRLRGGC